MLLVLGFYCCPARTRWGFKWGVLLRLIWGAQCGFTAISGVSWGISAWGWSPVWCVMAVMRSAGLMVSWSAPVVVSVMWSGAAPVWVITAVTSISVRVQLWSWPAILIPVPVMVPKSGSGVIPCAWVLSVMVCRCAWWWYPIWAVHCYVALFITFKILYIQAIMGNVAYLLALETLVSLIRHYINCRGRQQGGS